MCRPLLLAVAGSFLIVAVGSANTPPPPPVPAGHKVVKPRLVFEGLEKHADYAFYLSYGASGNAKRIEVKDSSILELDFKTGDVNPRATASLLAIKRERFDKRKAEDPSLKWLSSDVWTLAAKVTPLETTAPITTKEAPVATYRVTLKEGVLSLDKIEDKKSNKEPQSCLLPSWAFAIVTSLAISWLGIWFARRGSISIAS